MKKDIVLLDLLQGPDSADRAGRRGPDLRRTRLNLMVQHGGRMGRQRYDPFQGRV